MLSRAALNRAADINSQDRLRSGSQRVLLVHQWPHKPQAMRLECTRVVDMRSLQVDRIYIL